MKISKECIRKALNEGFRIIVLYPSSDLILQDVINIENVKRLEVNKSTMNMLIFKY